MIASCVNCGCDPNVETRGHRINRAASLGCHVIQLRAQLIELEKLARKTPPKTLLAEVARVAQAKATIEGAKERLAILEDEWSRSKTALGWT